MHISLSPLPLSPKNPFYIGQFVKAIIPHEKTKNTLSPRLRVVKVTGDKIHCQLDHFSPSSPVVTHTGNMTQFVPIG